MFSKLDFNKIFLTAIALAAIAGFVFFERGQDESKNNLAPHAVYLGKFENNLDLENVDEVFEFVLGELQKLALKNKESPTSPLPLRKGEESSLELTVLPSENYYYFSFLLGGKEIRGNIRLSPGESERDGGYLNFGYREFSNTGFALSFRRMSEFISKYKKFGPDDGLVIDKINDLKYDVNYGGEKVIFNLSNVGQTFPDYIGIRNGEEFVMRTRDESGYQFLLLFNKNTNDFLWILDKGRDERRVELSLRGLAKQSYINFLLDEQSGFVFWDDKEYKRKVLVGVSKENISKNTYFDGPFDQLADNYIHGTWSMEHGTGDGESPTSVLPLGKGEENSNILKFKNYLALAYPYLDGNIDEYGHLLFKESMRAAITPYYIYTSKLDLLEFLRRCEKKGDELEIYRCFVRDEKK